MIEEDECFLAIFRVETAKWGFCLRRGVYEGRRVTR